MRCEKNDLVTQLTVLQDRVKRPEGGEWEPSKIIAIENFGSRSKSAPQTQSPRHSAEQLQKSYTNTKKPQEQVKSSAEANTRNQLDNSTVYYHRLNRRIQLENVGLSGDTEPAAADSKHRLIRRPGLNSVGSTGERRRFNRQNQRLTSVQLSRGATKRTKTVL